ncbi:lanC-like protein 2 isoform X2 [Danaus plexippus]|uniref:lanC-like protein 2 isoform X2 n=1 Tax=Danaus plexippus TaxID=13037 RepID=UPI002AB085C1|nr:lanC-like protein 2 isoform X2 [Danaus plexippus]
MTTKGSFENDFDDYSPTNLTPLLNENRDGISEKFQAKLQNYKTAKFAFLTTKLEKELFCDGTVYTGSTGLALYYLMLGLGNHDSLQDNLQKALDYLDLDKLKGRRISFLCGDAGPLAIATVISHKLGTRRPNYLPDYRELSVRLLNLGSLLNDSPDELLYGKAGYLYSLLFVNKYVHGRNVISDDHIEKVASLILKSGKEFSQHTKSESPLLWQWHDKVYLGAAHGMAGILYILLQARAYIKSHDIRGFVRPTIDWLMKQQFPSGNFPSSLHSSSGDRLVQWCHGAPGFIPLCILAYQVFEEERYLKIAIQCGDLIWQRGLCAKGYSLCHGVSGNAYAFLQLYQVLKKPVYLHRAGCFMEWCAVERQGTELHRPDRPASLFEGLLGRIYLVEDIINPQTALFPGLCL